MRNDGVADVSREAKEEEGGRRDKYAARTSNAICGEDETRKGKSYLPTKLNYLDSEPRLDVWGRVSMQANDERNDCYCDDGKSPDS